MRTYGLFRAARVQLCLVLFFILGVAQVSANNQVSCATMALPQNATPLLPRSHVLMNMLDQVNPQRLMQTITALQNMGTRHVLSFKHVQDKGIGAAALYIRDAFKRIDPQSKHLIVTSQLFDGWMGDKKIALENIIATLPGSEPQSGTLVVGAHYDSRINDLNDGSSPAPGADDDALGIAALIEMAYILNASQPRLTVMFVAFSGEEIGRQGSKYFVRDLQARQIPIRAMINLDVVGGSGQVGNRIRLFSSGPDNSPSRSLARTIQFIADQYVPQLGVLVQDTADRANRYGDQKSFSDAGYQAVRFTKEIEDMGREHNALDTIAHIQPEYLADSTRAVLAAVKVLADGPASPQGLSLVVNADGSRSLKWDVASDAANYLVALRSTDSLVYDEQFEVIERQVTWTGFDSQCAKVLVVAAKNADGLMGTFSDELSLG